MKRGFTLLELIIVVMIVGVLATLGFASYGRQVEGSRTIEARQVFDTMRQMAYGYYMRNQNNLAGLPAADLGLGAGGVPQVCAPTHYFSYNFAVNTASSITFRASRCGAGGKAPNVPVAVPNAVTLTTDYLAGTDVWANVAPY